MPGLAWHWCKLFNFAYGRTRWVAPHRVIDQAAMLQIYSLLGLIRNLRLYPWCGTWTFAYLFEPALFVALAIARPLPGLGSRLPWGALRRG